MRALIVDVGTTALKAALAAPDGTLLASAEVPLRTSHPQPRHAEQDAEDWWTAFVAATREVLGATGASPDVLAVTGQMQDIVPLDAHGHPTGPAVLYSDRRAGAQHARLAAALPGWEAATRNAQGADSAPAVLAWLAEHDAARSGRRIALGAPGAVLARAGADLVCDLTTASTTGLLDRAPGAGWWAPALDAAGIEAAALPRLVTGAEVVGALSADAAGPLGLRAGLPLVHAPGDAGAAASGLVGEEPGALCAGLGTTAWICAVTPRSLGPDARLHDLVAAPSEDGALATLGIGAMLSAGATIDWARATHLPGTTPAAADAAAREHGPSGLLMVPSLSGERAPIRLDSARGAVVGLAPTTGPVALYRAALEGVALTLRHVADVIAPEALDTPAAEPLPVGGGLARSALLLDLLADALGRPVRPLADEHAGLRGAHRAAAHALGVAPPPPLADGATSRVHVPAGALDPGLRAAHAALWAALMPAFEALEAAERVAPPRSAP
ncbi:FGGY family carbohydrate kinase [Agilicoccus flavus]|uniref:FGGY family carbohydrate kinase n=1 Tax=Agilicoccus flavus TaxID=2775968 RepID=UPI001CF664E5|nr:FGGY family carbohydrate kinase [Agilicoccus flavus]